LQAAAGQVAAATETFSRTIAGGAIISFALIPG
jgi:hypothetical protein